MGHLLDAHYARRGLPIRLGGQHDYDTSCRPLEAERLAWLREHWRSAHEPLQLTPAEQGRQRLIQGLESMGGQFAIVASLEEDLAKLLERGQLWGATWKMKRGATSRCHSNSCLLFEANQHLDLTIATGYALSDDGLWRQHSWCVYRTPKSVRVIETTERRLMYFGFAMNLAECLEFGDNNTDFGIEIAEATKERFARLDAGLPETNRQRPCEA